MDTPSLTAADIEAMTVPGWERAKAAIAAGQPERAAQLIDGAAAQWRGLQDYSINWITSLLSFIGREMGEEAVERALREFGDSFLHSRRDDSWDQLPAPVRAKAIARSMVANFGTCDVSEDEEKLVLSFRCGTGGRLIDNGSYEGDDAYLTLTDAGPRTFGRDHLPVYCAHCSVNNEIQPVEWGRAPTTVESPPIEPGQPCVHHVYKQVRDIPADVYARIGQQPPAPAPA